MNEDLISDFRKIFHENGNQVEDPSVEIVVQQNLPCKIYMYEFAFKYKYNCNYCSTKSSLQNLHVGIRF